MPPRDPEARRKYNEAYRKSHAAETLAYQKQWRARKSEDPLWVAKRNERDALWRKANPEKWRAIRARNEKKHGAKNVRSRRNAKLKKDHGITYDEYEHLLAEQDGRCAICGADSTKMASRLKLFVDHNHKTNKRRGLLCNDCNVGLGRFQDSASLLRKAADYLERAWPSTLTS